MSSDPKPTRLGLLLLTGLVLGWGLNWPALKTALAGIPLWQFRATTLVASALALFVLARLAGQETRVPRARWPVLTIAALTNVTAWHVLAAYGVKLTPSSGHASILAFTMPVWAAAMGVVFLGERMTLRRFGSLLLGVGAIALLIAKNAAFLDASPLGPALVLLAAIAWAAGFLIQKHVDWPVKTLALAGWQLLIGAIPIVAIAAATETFTMHRASAAALGSALYVTAIAVVFCYYAWFRVIAIFPASVASISMLLVPVLGLFSGALFLGEPVGWHEIGALVLVVGALALVLILPAAEEAAPGRRARRARAAR